jgi:hypothetical protein
MFFALGGAGWDLTPEVDHAQTVGGAVRAVTAVPVPCPINGHARVFDGHHR